jgi:hypothetical protein
MERRPWPWRSILDCRLELVRDGRLEHSLQAPETSLGRIHLLGHAYHAELPVRSGESLRSRAFSDRHVSSRYRQSSSDEVERVSRDLCKLMWGTSEEGTHQQLQCLLRLQR